MKMIIYYNQYKSLATTTMAEQTKDKDKADMLSSFCRSLWYNHHPQNQVAVLCIVIGYIIARQGGVQVHTHSLPLIWATGWQHCRPSLSEDPKIIILQCCDMPLLLLLLPANSTISPASSWVLSRMQQLLVVLCGTRDGSVAGNNDVGQGRWYWYEE